MSDKYTRAALETIFNVFSRLGYGIVVFRRNEGAEYVRCLPNDYSTYCGWRQPRFQELYAKVKGKTACTQDRLYMIHEFARSCRNLKGDFAECGVYKGGSAYLIASVLANTHEEVELHLFDTFSGFPGMDYYPAGHKKGDFGDTSLESVKSYLSDFPLVTYHQGLIPSTLETAKERMFSFVHVDVDLYEPARDCCEFFYSRMVKNGMMLFDDYGIQCFEESIRRAVDEFFRDKAERPIALRTGQCLVIKERLTERV